MGILVTSFVTLIFVLYRDTPVVKSSSRELCYIILAGIFLGYICPFTLIARPTVFSCYLQRLLVGLSAAMCYSALVTKTNRIARILAGSKKKICTRKPRSVCLSVDTDCLSVRLAVYRICLPAYLPACLSICLSVCLSVCRRSVYLFVCLYILSV